MSNAITPAPTPPGESAPSVLRDDDPGVARFIGMAGALLVIFGGAALLFNRAGRATAVSPGWATLALAFGLVGLLFHAAFDRDVQFRRLYLGFALVTLGLGAFLCILPYPEKAGEQFGPGFVCLTLALLFLLAFLRNETEPGIQRLAQRILLFAGGGMALIGLAGANIKAEMLVPIGLLLALLGLVYLAAYVASRGTDNETAYRVGLGLGFAGALVFLIALGRSAIPALVNAFRSEPTPGGEYYMPTGLLLMALGALYGLVSLAICSDNRLVVLTRRELGAFFYSPIAYFVLLAFTLAAWVTFFQFVGLLSRQAIEEPIILPFVLNWPPVLCLLIAVPALTMRLMSEEHRSGTLEVLLTTPVDEVVVTLSKFLAALVMFLLVWAPFGLFLIALYLGGGKPFDYRPLLSFFLGLVATGAGFVSMGLFFSSLTRNQIIAGVLTFVCMTTLTLMYLARGMFQGELAGTAWPTVLTHISYLDVWVNTLDGRVMPKFLLFHVSITALWLWLTVKVLEARKWT